MPKKTIPNVMIHHVIYAYSGTKHKQEGIVIPIYTTEHHLLTSLQRRGKNVSKGFLDALRYFIWEHEVSSNYADLTGSNKYQEYLINKEKTNGANSHG